MTELQRSALPSAASVGWLWAVGASIALVAALAAAGGARSVETIGLDLKHRWIAANVGDGSPQLSAVLSPGIGPSARPAAGANVFLEQEVDPQKRQRSLQLLRAAGVTSIRQQLPWRAIEPIAHGQFVNPNVGGSTWAPYDDIVSRSNASGMSVILRIDTSPSWALEAGAATNSGPPAHYQDYWDFVRTVAERYRGRVSAYQIWNEPNLSSEWGGKKPAPPDYARLLRGAAREIRLADPQALVVSAALAPTLTESPDALNELLYWQGLYAAGVQGSYDVLAVQAYGLRGGPDDPRIGPEDVTISRPLLVRNLMLQHGDGAIPVWATEVGWDATPPDLPVQRFGHVTPMLQARYTARLFTRAKSEWPWMDMLNLWYWKRADWADRQEDWYWFRLAEPDFTLQPVYFALRDFGT